MFLKFEIHPLQHRGVFYILKWQLFMIKKTKNKYVVLSETTGRKFGTYKTKKEATKRLRQVEYFSAKGGSALGGKRQNKKPP